MTARQAPITEPMSRRFNFFFIHRLIIMKKLLIAIAAITAATACTVSQPETTDSGLHPDDFADTIGGKTTALYTLRNKAGMEVCVTNFGGRIVSINVPDRDGRMRDVVLGFDSVADYVNIPSDFGATIGRYANRIDSGRFSLDGVDYQCRRTITATASTADRAASSIRYSTPSRCPLPNCV